MAPERNAPCPCGSGKKYKKCCGLPAAQSSPDSFSFNRAIAYKGSVGKLREAFCVNYAAVKKSITLDIESNHKQDAASLQECECIVHYLYHHNETLRNFLRAYDAWIGRIARIESCFDRINSLHGKTLLSQESAQERQIFNAEQAFYESQNIPCPFLFDGLCSIYEVRPYICASVVSLSPPDWCKRSHPDYIHAVYLKTELRRENDMPYFMPLRDKIFFADMPLLVHDILEQGYDTLSSVRGLRI